MRYENRRNVLPAKWKTVNKINFEKLQSHVVTPIAIWVASRLIVLVSWCVSTAFVSSAGLKESFLRWDGGWYFSIVLNGYNSQRGVGASNIAFFPGFPLFSRAISWLPFMTEYRATVFFTLFIGLISVVLFNFSQCKFCKMKRKQYLPPCSLHLRLALLSSQCFTAKGYSLRCRLGVFIF